MDYWIRIPRSLCNFAYGATRTRVHGLGSLHVFFEKFLVKFGMPVTYENIEEISNHTYNNQPHVVEWERSIINTDLFDVYECFGNELAKYGLLHIRNLLKQTMGDGSFRAYSDSATNVFNWKSWDTVLSQGPGVAVYTTQKIDKNGMTFKSFERTVRKERMKLGELTEVCPYSLYWNTIDNSMQRYQSPTDTFYNLVLPDDYVAYYALQANVAGLRCDADLWYPHRWNQHSSSFCGPRNLLLDERASNYLPGMASPHSYFYRGTAYTSFPHHFEDYWMPSVNFLYWGAEKYWLGVPASETRRIWDYIRELAKITHHRAEEKRFLLSPKMLTEAGFSVVHVHQLPGDVVISASGATHGGFNLGDNFAEAVNFVDKLGSDGWLSMYDDMSNFYLDELDKSIPRILTDIMNT